MLTHIVWWTLKPEAHGKTAAQNAVVIKGQLEALYGKIPSLKKITVGMEILGSSTEALDLVLVTEHDNAEGLAAYASHPDHMQVAVYLKEAAASRKAIDFLS